MSTNDSSVDAVLPPDAVTTFGRENQPRDFGWLRRLLQILGLLLFLGGLALLLYVYFFPPLALTPQLPDRNDAATLRDIRSQRVFSTADGTIYVSADYRDFNAETAFTIEIEHRSENGWRRLQRAEFYPLQAENVTYYVYPLRAPAGGFDPGHYRVRIAPRTADEAAEGAENAARAAFFAVE